MVNYIKSQGSNSKNITCDIGVQMDSDPVLSETIIQNQVCLPGYYSELTTEPEGVKLDIVINESKITNGLHTNMQSSN